MLELEHVRSPSANPIVSCKSTWRQQALHDLSWASPPGLHVWWSRLRDAVRHDPHPGRGQSHMTNRHAVVLGAGMAGLLAARVLGESFDRVTVIDRDPLPAGDDDRRGVPQGRHVHGFQARGVEVVERAVPWPSRRTHRRRRVPHRRPEPAALPRRRAPAQPAGQADRPGAARHPSISRTPCAQADRGQRRVPRPVGHQHPVLRRIAHHRRPRRVTRGRVRRGHRRRPRGRRDRAGEPDPGLAA